MSRYATSLAKVDRQHCTCPGLFRSFQKGKRDAQTVNIKYWRGKDTKEFITVTCKELLGAPDLRVFQGLIALATRNDRGIELQPGGQISEESRQLVAKMALSESAKKSRLIYVRTTYYEVAKEIGMPLPVSASQISQILESLRRMRAVLIEVKKPNEGGKTKYISHNLLAELESEGVTPDETGPSKSKILVAFNPRIADAILGGGRYAQVDMNEVRILKTDAARLIYQRLCGFVSPGSEHPKPIGLPVFEDYIWCTHINEMGPRERDSSCAPISESADVEELAPLSRTRKMRILKALKELGSLPGWEFKLLNTGKVQVRRGPGFTDGKRLLPDVDEANLSAV